MKKPIAAIIFILMFFSLTGVSGSEEKQVLYVGSETCKACHEEVYNKWKSSKHAAEFVPEQENSQVCNECHLNPPGIPNQSEMVNNIGCEACHGPGEEHISDPEDKAKIVSSNSADICGRCHNGNQSGNNTSWTKEYTPGMKLADIKGLKLIPVSPDKLPPPPDDSHPLMIYNMWLVSGHAKTPDRDFDINGKKWTGPVTCTACHSPHNSDNAAQLVMKPKELCVLCHFQGEVLKGVGAKGIEETRNLHTATPCFSCHMTEENHLMKVLRPDDPNLPADRIDSCTACHKVGAREMRARQIKDMEDWYNDAMEPVQKNLKIVEDKLKENPDILNAELKAKLKDVKDNLSIIINDGSNGVHNLDYALEIMSLAKKQLKEIKQGIQ